MLPNLRIILAAMIVTCAAVLALSAGMLGTRDPANNLTGVPGVSRTLVRQAVVEEPEWQQIQLLGYSRRADELQRLRDLPVTPARAVVEYAEQAQARAAESASAPATPVAAAPVAPASEPAPTIVATAPIATPPAGAPTSPAADSGAAVVTPSADTPPPAMAAVTLPATAVANAPVAAPPADAASATAIVSAPVSLPAVETPVAAPAYTAPASVANAAPTVAAPVATPAASGDTQVAAVQTGGSETAEMYGPPQPKARKRHVARAAHAHPAKPKKNAQVAGTTQSVAPAASTGFPVDPRNNRPNTLGNWRAGSVSTTR